MLSLNGFISSKNLSIFSSFDLIEYFGPLSVFQNLIKHDDIFERLTSFKFPFFF